MEQALDTLAASRKLEDSGMPERQADAVVDVVNDAMKNLVTKEYLTAELDRRFGAVDMHSSQKVLIGLMLASTLAIIAMQITVLAILY